MAKRMCSDLKGTKFINQHGDVLEVNTTLAEFCRVNSFCYEAIHVVIRGDRRHYKGWVLLQEGITAEGVKKIVARETHHKGVKVVTPKGDILEIETTLRDFCNSYNLCYNSMNDVICGRRNNYKGIHLLGVDAVDGRVLAGPKLREKFTKGLDKFVEEARARHGDKYDYSLVEYINTKTKVRIICPIHGEFLQAPSGHLKTDGCRRCWFERGAMERKDTTGSFIRKAVEKHGDKYDYSLVEYKKSNTKVKIVCKKHHQAFLQRPNRHLQGDGCPYCSGSGWSKDHWLGYFKKKKHKVALLYVVNLKNDREDFIKIGITSKSIEERFDDIPYQYNVINTIEGPPSYIWDLEQQMLLDYRQFKYVPEIYFAGNTECLDKEVINHLQL